MLAELKTIFWLQWRLTRSMFRSRRAHLWARLGRILLMILLLGFTMPFFAVMGALLGITTATVTPQAAFELLILVNTGILFLWLLLPASYNSEIVERFEVARLFVHPISLRSLVTGSTLVSLFSFVGVWTCLFMLGEVIGLAWHSPLALPLILLGAVPLCALLIFSGRLMEDLFDLVASDRRLRGLLVFLLTLPFILVFFCNYAAQFATDNFEQAPAFVEQFFRDMPAVEGLSFSEGFSIILTHLQPSRYLLWLPPGWATAGMALVVVGEWGRGLFFLVISILFSIFLLWAHAAITRRMMQGSAIRIGTERVRSRRWGASLPGPQGFWTLMRKDLTYLRRSPTTIRALIATPFMIIAFAFVFWQVLDTTSPINPLFHAAPVIISAMLLVTVNFGTSTLTANYFGAIDREGFASLMLCPTDRRYVFLSANAATLLFALALSLVLLLAVAILMKAWIVLPWGILFAFCLHVSTVPAYNLTSIIGPYRAPMEAWSNKGGNAFALLAWGIATPPVPLMLMLPYLFWKPGLYLTIPLALFYSIGLYALSLKPLARLMDRRTHQIFEAVSTTD
jgi:hypothetical protein